MNIRAFSLLVAPLLLCATACESSEPGDIRVGILADCEGFGAAYYDVTLAGAELPLLRRGGSLMGSGPADGVEGVLVDQHPVQLVFACAGDSIGAVLEARRLIELEDVDVLIGPNVLPDTLALVAYAGRHPERAFVIATMEHTTGLDLGRNVFRFTADSVQTAAGLGAYAFNELGWRRARTVAIPDLWEWGLQAGFVAEFCSLGGSVGGRYWQDVLPDDVRAAIASIPLEDPDGFFLATDTLGVRTFLQRYARRHPRLGRRIVSGAFGSTPNLLDPTVVERLGDRLLGIVTASFVPLDASQSDWNAYVDEFDTAFPALGQAAASADHLFDIDYFNAMEAVMRALEAVRGDLSDGSSRFLQALSEVRLDAPNGPIELDDRLQAIVPIYLSRVEEDEQGNLVYRTFRRIDGVDQTYGGAVRMTTPTPDRTQPVCRHGDPPPWAAAT